jgi:predicted PurR-regulated permease PerM
MAKRILSYLTQNELLFALFLIFCGWILIKIQTIALILFVAFILAAGLSPISTFLRRRKIPKILAVITPYLVIVAAIVMLGVLILPPAIAQTRTLVENLPFYLDQLARLLSFGKFSFNAQSFVSSELKDLGQSALDLTAAFFKILISIAATFVVSIYLLYDETYIVERIANLIAPERRRDLQAIAKNVEKKLGAWLRGQLYASLIVGVLSGTALAVAGVDFALVLALVTAVLEIIPFFGPVLSGFVAAMVALHISASKALLVVLIYIVIHQIEGNIIIPNVMRRTIGLHPLTVIIAVAIGEALLGIIGALVAVPFTAFVYAIWEGASSLNPKSRTT